MKITTREEKISTTINYNDGCTKTIQHFKVYLGHMKTPTFKYKIVDFRYPDGEIDEDRSYDRKIIDDDTDEEFTDTDEEYTDTESDSESKSGSEEESEEESGEESEEETNTSLISVSNSEEQFVLPEPKVDISKKKMNSVLGIRENTTIDIDIDISDLDNIVMEFYS